MLASLRLPVWIANMWVHGPPTNGRDALSWLEVQNVQGGGVGSG